MGFNYYQNAGSGWGTNHFQFGPPPVPDFQPQPGWGGMDYFRAHAFNPDPSLYNHAFSSVREYANSGHGFGLGVGMHEAKQFHRMAYGGLSDVDQMRPEDIGHAAAYEAYRTWMHNSSIYEPLSGDMERQREGLIGLAVAEATRLLGRSWDSRVRMTAGEAAAATASYIFTQTSGMDMEFGDPYRMGRPRSRMGRSHSRSGLSRHNSFSGYVPTAPYSDSPLSSMYGDYPFDEANDPYAHDDGYGFGDRRGRRHHRSRSRHRRHSISNPMMMMDQPGYGMGGMGGVGGFGGGYAGSGYTNSYPVPASSYSSYGGGMPGSYPISTSYPVGGVPYGGSAYGQMGGIPVSGGSQVIVATKPRRHSRHRSSSRHSHRRSRSRNRGVIVDGGGFGGGYPGSYY